MEPSPRPSPPPTIEYARRVEPRLHVADYLVQCVTAALFIGLLVGSMALTGRLKQIFADFGLKLPLVTQLVLDVQGWFDALYLWAVLWIVPLVLPLFLTRARPAARRWLLLLSVLLAAVLLLVVFATLVLPLITLIEGISGRPAGR